MHGTRAPIEYTERDTVVAYGAPYLGPVTGTAFAETRAWELKRP